MAAPAQGLRASFDDEIKLDTGERAVVRFVGEVQGKTGLFYGIELRDGAGKNNGTVQNVQYFVSKFKRKDSSRQPVRTGSFVRGDRIGSVTNKSRHIPDICVGDRVQVNAARIRGVGVIRYIGISGDRPTSQTIRVGVELDERTRGGTDGSMKSQPGFFSCAAGRGVYVRPEEVAVEAPARPRRSRRSRGEGSATLAPTVDRPSRRGGKKSSHARSRSAGRGSEAPTSPGHGRSSSVSNRIAMMQAALFNEGINESKEMDPPKKKKKKKKKKAEHRRAASEMPAWKIKQLELERQRAEMANQAPVNSPANVDDDDDDDKDDGEQKIMSLSERRAAYSHSATVGVEEAAARRIQKRPSIQNLEVNLAQKQRARHLLERRIESQATAPNAMMSIYEDAEDSDPDSKEDDADRGRSRSRTKKRGHKRSKSRFKVEEVDINDAKLIMTQFGFFQPKDKPPDNRSRRTRSTTRAPNPGTALPIAVSPNPTPVALFTMPEPLVILNMNNTDMLQKMGESEKVAMTRLIAHSIIQSPDLEVIKMCNASIDDDFLIILLDTLSQHEGDLSVTELWLESNPLGNAGFTRLSEFITADDTIEVWKFQRNKQDIATDVIDTLLTAIEGNERIVKFEFEFRFTDMRDRVERQLRRNQETKRLTKLAARRAAEAATAAME